MSLRDDMEKALEGFRTTIAKLDNDIRRLESILDIHLDGTPLKQSNVEGLKAVEKAMSIPSKPIGELK